MKFVKRIVIYLAGLFFVALGVAFSVNSNLGVSPVNSLPYVVSRILGKDLGTCVTVIFIGYILIQILLLRKAFRPLDLAQILCSFAFGYFVDLTETLLGSFCLPGYPGRLVMLAISIFLVAFGICLYLDTDLIVMPMEGLTAAMNKTVFPKKAFHEVKVILDCTVVVVGIVLCFVFLGELQGIREGTVRPVSWKSDETYAESAGSDCKEILLITFNTYFKLNSPFRGAVLRKSMSLIFLLGTSNLT